MSSEVQRVKPAERMEIEECNEEIQISPTDLPVDEIHALSDTARYASDTQGCTMQTTPRNYTTPSKEVMVPRAEDAWTPQTTTPISQRNSPRETPGSSAWKRAFARIPDIATPRDTAKQTSRRSRATTSRLSQLVQAMSAAETVTAGDANLKVLNADGHMGTQQEERENYKINSRLKTIVFDAIRDGSDLTDAVGFFIDPRSPARNNWDLFMIIFVMYNTVFIPYQMSFKTPPSEVREAFEVVIDLLFLLDIVLNFYTAYFDSNGRLVASREEIKKTYLRTWFPIDLLASFPLEHIMLIFGANASSDTQVFSLLKFPRLLRLGRLLKYLNKMKNSDMVLVIRIVELVVLVGLICHWMGCAWHMTCEVSEACADRLETMSPMDIYLDAYYVATLSLMGDGIDTDSRMQKVMVICMTLFGSFMMAVVFGSVANMVNRLNMKEAYHSQKVDSLNDVMRYLELPMNIQERIRQHHEYAWMRYRDMEGGIEGFAKLLPTSLAEEVLYSFHSSLLEEK
ncbi:hypothetical protein CYMTET_20173, partial [Cymbomonas tetramitiformis]